MARNSQRGRLHALASLVYPALALRSAAFAQGEGEGTVGWDPREGGTVSVGWELLALLPIGVACFGLWRLLGWFLQARREKLPWTLIRYGWPTAMVVWGWAVALVDGSESGLFAITFLVINSPVIGIMALLMICVEALGWRDALAGWPAGLIASGLGWLVWHLILRVLEWRAWSAGTISLNLTRERQ